MAEAPAKYHIIGAGIAGLSAAQRLRKKYPQAEITLYEAAARPGGRCFSFYDRQLGIMLDNATHALVRANTRAAKIVGKEDFSRRAVFYDYATGKINTKAWQNVDDKALALFNQPLKNTAPGIVLKTFCKLFPFTPGQLNLWFSHGDLNSKLVAPLAAGTDIKTGWKLQSFSERHGFIYKLDFNKASVAVLPQDNIICALDAYNFNKIFGGTEFAFNEIINIFYRTGMQISLPGGQNLLGIRGAKAQWLFASPGLLAVTISNAKVNLTDEELASTVWKEVCTIRGHAAAFLPSYRVIRHKRATIRQDKANNDQRPDCCKSLWKNLFLCGDWTMRDWPCSIEAALASAQRVVKKL